MTMTTTICVLACSLALCACDGGAIPQAGSGAGRGHRPVAGLSWGNARSRGSMSRTTMGTSTGGRSRPPAISFRKQIWIIIPYFQLIRRPIA